jgi:hypothetical protein
MLSIGSANCKRAAMLAALATVFLSTIALPQDPTINSRRTPPMTRDMRYREWSLKNLEKKSSKAPAEQRLAWEQIREDFKRIQVLDNDLVKHKASNETPNAKFVEKAAAEIRKRAGRLQSNLMFPNDEITSVEKTQNEYQMNTLLSGLSGLIRRFINNPVFGETDVLDVQAAMNANRDLNRIIELSEQIKKKAQSQK